jgi:predicted nucleotidyltransferase
LAISSLIHQQGFLKKTNFGFVTDAIKEKLADCIYIMVLFGSHVKGKARKDSDVDILFVAQHPSDIEPMRIRIQSVLSSTNIPVEFELVTCKSLQDMFGKKNTIGNEILHTSIPLYGAEQYYTMVNDYDKKRGH